MTEHIMSMACFSEGALCSFFVLVFHSRVRKLVKTNPFSFPSVRSNIFGKPTIGSAIEYLPYAVKVSIAALEVTIIANAWKRKRSSRYHTTLGPLKSILNGWNPSFT